LSSASIIRNRILFLVTLLLLALPKLYAEQNNFDGLPNISTRSEGASSSWVVSADFLAWYASQEVASIWADHFTIGLDTSSWIVPGFNFKWDYGFRIGTGYDLVHDQWDTALYWTWFRTDAKHSIPFNPDTFFLQPEFFAAFLTGNTSQRMSGKWSLLLNMFDWELGRSYWISKGLSFRPFLGLKGGWINQTILVHYFNLTINDILTNNTGSERVKNNFWGIGPLGGINTKWKVANFGSHFFDFFGDFSMATMWGTWKNSDIYKNTASQTSSVNIQNSTLGALMLRGFVGIGWDADFNKSSSHFAAKLGFETQLWVNQLRLATFQLQRLHTDLTFHGITLNCRFDF